MLHISKLIIWLTIVIPSTAVIADGLQDSIATSTESDDDPCNKFTSCELLHHCNINKLGPVTAKVHVSCSHNFSIHQALFARELVIIIKLQKTTTFRTRNF